MLDENAPLSLYQQLREIFAEKIAAGEWRIDEKIPSEAELCTQYSVSRITVRQALDRLKDDGLLYRKQGRGTFVTQPKVEQTLNRFYSFSDDVLKKGAVSSAKVIDLRPLRCSGPLAEALELPPGTPLLALKRLRLADGDPFAVEVSYLPASLFPGFSREDVAKNGLYNTFRTQYRVFPDKASETIEAVIIDAESAKYLHTSRSSAGFHLTRTTRAAGTVVEYCDSIVRGDRYKYTIELR